MSGNTETHSEQLDEIIAEYLQSAEAGTPPDREELLSQYPELASELQEFFADQERFARMAAPLKDSFPRRQFVPPTVRYFGGYELLDEIARGGMGVVYKARQERLSRIVAVKMILSGHLATEEDVKRFQSEAQAAAGLQHPHIVAVHEVGQHAGHHYFSMDYVEGRSLADLIRENPLPPRRAAAYVRQAAEAIHYAHQQGTLHRDLKPSNILIDGNDQVRITDFGLAMRVEGDSQLTRTGQVLGSPSYMPPEQAQGKRSLIGPASDVYALGAILYEVLTGRPPFRADSPVETIQQVISTEAASPRLLNHKVPRDLETICLKCLEKEPHKRYGTAQLLADDLGRYARGEPIQARPIGRAAQLWRWCRRNRIVAALAGLSVALLIAGTAVSLLFAVEANERAGAEAAERRRADKALDEADRRGREAEANARLAQRHLGELEVSNRRLTETVEREQQANYYSNILLAWREWQAGHFERAEKHLTACRADLRSWEWHYLARLCRPTTPLAVLERVSGVRDVHDGLGPPGIGLSGDGRRIAYLCGDRTISVLDTSTGKEVFRVSDVGHEVLSLAISYDGRKLAARGMGSLTIWNTGPAEAPVQRKRLPGEYNRLKFSPDCSRLIASRHECRAVSREDSLKRESVLGVSVLDTTSGQVLASYGWGTAAPGICAYSADGRRVAVMRGSHCTVTAVDEADTVAIVGHEATIAGGIFSRDGTRMATFDIDSNIIVSDATNGEPISAWRLHPERIERIGFSPDGSKIATLSFISNLKLWETSSGRLVRSLRESEVERARVAPLSTAAFGPFSFHRFLAFSPDGFWLASASGEHKVTVWNLVTGGETVLRTRDPLRFAAFRGDTEHQLLYATQAGPRPPAAQQPSESSLHLSQWNSLGREESRLLYRDGWSYHTVAVNDAGTKIASVSKPGRDHSRHSVKVWDLQSGAEELSVPWDSGGELFEVAFSPDDSRLAVAGNRGITIVDRATGQSSSELEQTLCHRVTFCQDGRRILVARRSGASIDDLQTGEPVVKFGYPQWCACAVLNADETKVATAGQRGGVYIWNATTGEQLLDLSMDDSKIVFGVAFSPDADRLATADGSGRVLIWDACSGKRLLELTGHDGRVYTVAFSPDGKRVISMGDDCALRVWDSRTGQEVLSLTGHADRVFSAVFTRDGSMIISTSADGTIRIWDGTPIPAHNGILP